MQSHIEVGTALRGARIALALPLDSIARELKIPVAHLRAIELGTTGSFHDVTQRTDVSRRVLARFQLPEGWADLQPAATEWPDAPLSPAVAAPMSPRSARLAPMAHADLPALLAPKPITPRQRLIALGVASVVVATAIGAALIPAAPPVDENELEDLRSSSPSTTSKAAQGISAQRDAGREANTIAAASPSDAGEKLTSTQSMPVAPTPTTASLNQVPGPDSGSAPTASRPYAVLPGSQIVTPPEPALELKARSAVAVDLVLEQGSTQIAMRAGDRIVLMSGRAERIEVSDRHAVELEMTGRAIRLEPVAVTDANPNRGIWSVAGR